MALRSSSRIKNISATLPQSHLPPPLASSPGSQSPTTNTSPTLEQRCRASKSSPVANKNAMDPNVSASDITIPVTYTPTTHRISKAKKGKRVHACEYPGCNKVFTRAEHKRRHELNHNPDAFCWCSQPGCKKAFRRSDLLARHVERHALDIKGDNIVEWQPQIQAATMPEYVPVAPNTAPFLASTQRSTPVLAGSTTAPAVHTEPPTDCPLLWSGMDMPLQHRETLFPYQVSESAEDSPFYSSPGPSASPLSDGVTLSMSPYPQPSVSPAPTMAIEPYPEDILKTDTAPSPLQAHNGLRSWGSSDLSMSMVPATLDGVIIQPDVQYPYSPPAWTSGGSMPYYGHAPLMT